MDIHQILKQFWGYGQFRPLQQEIIQSVLDGNDTLALLPTGGGKSICYQVPALALPGICIVVSPLIALMKDQVGNLRKRGVKAIGIVSGMTKREIDNALDSCIYGEVKLLYLSPERLNSELVKERIKYMNVSFLAVDEAHCISQWGYDFRPSYLRIAELREILPNKPVMALTATATKEVVIDIKQKLAFTKEAIFQKSFERKNLAYVVLKVEDKLNKMVEIASKIAGTGIVYVRNRRETQEVAKFLVRSKIPADFYHAGLDPAIRAKKQDKWMNGTTRVMVATNAFGMGIDKPDVRFVVHLEPPDSLEAYYQEAGRAGRDELKSYAVLLVDNGDPEILDRKNEQAYPSVEEIKNTYKALCNYLQVAVGAGFEQTFDIDFGNFCSTFKLNAINVLKCFHFLERDALLSFSESVWLPSRLKIVVSNQDLYAFQVKFEQYDTVLKTILRSYGGVFDTFVKIDEIILAKRIGVTKKELNVILSRLDQLQIISYAPQNDNPTVTFLQPRVAENAIYINKNYLSERKKIYSKQIQSVKQYAFSSDICRSNLLLAYFGELESANCGVCDVCLELAKTHVNAAELEKIKQELEVLLLDKNLTIKEISSLITSLTKHKILKAIQFLIDDGTLQNDEFGRIGYSPE